MPVIDRWSIEGVLTVKPDVHGDKRGQFMETYRREWFRGGHEMVQGSRSDKTAGSLVGMHYHLHQTDYWTIPMGRARVGLHDLRTGSPSEGVSVMIEVGAAAEPGGDHDHRGILIPPGVAHGFLALTDMTLMYLVDGYYNPEDEHGVAWDDPDLKLSWGVKNPVVSGRDRNNYDRRALPPQLKPFYSREQAMAEHRARNPRTPLPDIN